MIERAVKFYSLKDLWKNIKTLPENRKYISGGTDITLSLKHGIVNPLCLIDISDIKELTQIKKQGRSVFIGSSVKISEFEKNDIIKKYVPSLYQSVKYYACPTVRNIATLGGNVANASPCADGALALVSARAKAVLNLYGRKRICSVKDIFIGPKKTLLKKDEIIEHFIIPVWSNSVFLKSIPRKIFGISKAGLCVCAEFKKDFISDISIAASSVGPNVIDCAKTAQFLKGKKITEDITTKAKEIIKTEISPITDHRSTSKYRKEITGVFLKRALDSLR